LSNILLKNKIIKAWHTKIS